MPKMKISWPLRRASGALLALLTACATAPPPPDSTSRSPFVEPPGAVFAEVQQTNIKATICVPGWTATVRPSTSYTQGVKHKMLRDAGVPESEAIKYELDHFVPLALGGHPRSIDNLWLQRWDGSWNARVKDRLERALQVKVCAGQIALDAARMAIEQDWKRAYEVYVGRARVTRESETLEEEVVE
jgi:hypothetical protein